MAEASKKIFYHRSFIGLLFFGTVAVCYKLLHLKDHRVSAFSFPGDLLFIWIPLLLCFVIGTFSLLRYRKYKGTNDLIISLLPVLFTLLIILLRLFEGHAPG